MPFCFNFNVEQSDTVEPIKTLSGTDNLDAAKNDGFKKDVDSEETLKWFPAEEIFLSEQHYAKEGFRNMLHQRIQLRNTTAMAVYLVWRYLFSLPAKSIFVTASTDILQDDICISIKKSSLCLSAIIAA